ncbi:YaaA family protein [Microlunatus speluncae]|uniref:YaaA family protein n=1 Tax=Microlunatus speluncae TaxID=2594267 RepID=UPI0012666FE0|nr:peroxide stress protein YaaA [Microlunatus speluncae]
MLILLPPSEGKAAPTRRGRPVELDRLSHPELTDARLAVRDALIKVSGHPDALRLLDVSPGLAAEVDRNTRLETASGLPVARVYTGVLYDALDYAGLSAAGRRRANRVVRVQSALWGPVGPTDRIAPYRLSMGVSLPGLGSLARHWRSRLGPVLGPLAGTGAVIDCRSSSYTGAWQPGPDAIRRYVAIRPFTEIDGRRVAISHQAKHTRGLVARLLLEADSRPRTPQAVAELVGTEFRCELVDHGRRGFSLDVIHGAVP